jgi:uncharacterized membrane protein YeaQ/YmgE (transglycosylase-associated protein family)
MNWIITLVVGGIIGWLASLLMKTNAQMGIIANVIVGIIGSTVGFWLAGVLGIAADGPVAGGGGRSHDPHLDPEGHRALQVGVLRTPSAPSVR